MAFLTLNGFEIPVEDGEASRALVEIGERSRAFSGAGRVTRAATKREFEFKTTPASLSDALAYAGLIQGDGHVWSFTAASSYSSKGLALTTLVGIATFASPATPKYAGAVNLSGGSVVSSISYTVGTYVDYTVAVWRSTNAGAAWTRHIIRSDGSKWVNGVASGVATPWLTMTTPTLQLADTTVAAVAYDDLVFYPFKVPTTWATGSLSTAVTAWPNTPELAMSGDVVNSASLTVHGQVTSDKFLQAYMIGAFANNNAQVSFTLREV